MSTIDLLHGLFFISSDVLAAVLMHAMIEKKAVFNLMFAATGGFVGLLGQKRGFVANGAALMELADPDQRMETHSRLFSRGAPTI